MDAEVYWSGRRVGLLRGVRVDQPYYRGEWVPATDSEFTAALLAQQWLPVLFRSPDGTTSAPARVLTSRTPGVGIYFRFGFWSDHPAGRAGMIICGAKQEHAEASPG
jgi:hypothetical protein